MKVLLMNFLKILVTVRTTKISKLMVAIHIILFLNNIKDITKDYITLRKFGFVSGSLQFTC